MRVRLSAALVALLTIGGIGAAAAAPQPPALTTGNGSAVAPRDDADASEHYFFSGDGLTRLHADVLRPVGLTDEDKTPVILSVSPYTSHNGQTTDTDLSGSGPSPRFYDFLDLSGALTEGYTYVMVDLPGFGGSGGCNDWGGNREQAAVRAAVEWAASQPWSTGKVALLGKSYDGWTGLMGIAQQPQGLAAVVSLEPVFDGYRYIWMNGVRRSNTVGTLSLFQAIDAKPGRPSDSPEYLANSAPQAWCYGVNAAGAALDDDPNGPYWQERNLIPTTLGKTTPLLLTQGFLETNTKPDGAFQYWGGLAGNENRAWFGQFDHCRGWETYGACKGSNDDALALGRAGFVDDVMSFLDEHLKGIEPRVEEPAIEIQDILGRYRAEAEWPPADSRLYESALNTGTYTDVTGSSLNPTATQGIWTTSEPLPYDVWLSGEPVVTVGVDAVLNANLAAGVYDIDEEGGARLMSRGVSLLRGTGIRTASFTLYGQDWPVAAGHRIGVLLSGGNSDEFTHVSTRSTVTVRSAKIGLPFLTYNRTEFLGDGPNPTLDAYVNRAWPTLSLDGLERPFNLPGPLQARP